MQYYKAGDIQEKKVSDAASGPLTLSSTEEDSFFNQAYRAYNLGDVLYDLGRDPMTGVITRTVFRTSFPAIHDLFTRAGTFEFYMEVFKAIWGEGVVIEFEVPSPGVLNININAVNASLDFFTVREIIDEQYVLSDIVDHNDDFIMFQTIQGIKKQREVDALINEISPAGIFVTADLELG